jgi:hypothetical protein
MSPDTDKNLRLYRAYMQAADCGKVTTGHQRPGCGDMVAESRKRALVGGRRRALSTIVRVQTKLDTFAMWILCSSLR